MKDYIILDRIFWAGSIGLVKETIMLNPTSLLADALGRNLAETYRRIFGDQEPRIACRP